MTIVIPILLVASTLDLLNNNLFIGDVYNEFLYRLLFFVFGVILMAAGASMLIVSTFPAGIYEELMLTVMRIFKTNRMGLTRLVIEFSIVILALLIGIIGGFGFGGINIGTIIISIFFGYILRFFLSAFKKLGY